MRFSPGCCPCSRTPVVEKVSRSPVSFPCFAKLCEALRYEVGPVVEAECLGRCRKVGCGRVPQCVLGARNLRGLRYVLLLQRVYGERLLRARLPLRPRARRFSKGRSRHEQRHRVRDGRLWIADVQGRHLGAIPNHGDGELTRAQQRLSVPGLLLRSLHHSFRVGLCLSCSTLESPVCKIRLAICCATSARLELKRAL